MIKTRSFTFPHEAFTINAVAFLYADGMPCDVEIEAVWSEGLDVLPEWQQLPVYRYLLLELKRDAMHHIARVVFGDTCDLFYDFETNN